MRKFRAGPAIALGVGMAMLLAACGSGGSSSTNSASSNKPVTITWWHNGNNDPLKSFWQTVATEYQTAHPNVKIEITALQSEDLRTRLTAALQSNDPPNLFQQWGGGEMADQVKANLLMDISATAKDEIASVGGSAAGWQVNGKTYGLPWSLGVVGFWYNKALFTQAGITQAPVTMADLFTAIDKLKAAGIAPIAVGAADKWPAAHYWYYTAVRECSAATMQKAGLDFNFSDPCFVKAGDALKAIIDKKPFNEGFLGTSAQKGATSSAGLLANGKVAIELMGHWDPSVMNGLTADQKGLGSNLGWFPFPSIPDGKGAADAAMGGGDGFSCSAKAPPECAGFLKYIMSVDVQKRFGATGVGLPTVKGSESGVTDANMVGLMKFRSSASYVQLYLDVAYGANIGGALNDAVALMFAGQATPQDVVTAVQSAAKKQ